MWLVDELLVTVQVIFTLRRNNMMLGDTVIMSRSNNLSLPFK
jgi:hypothetical protein